MTNHPNRSRRLRTVALKIQEGGRLAAVSEHSTSDLTIKVTGVPVTVTPSDVIIKLSKLSLLRRTEAGLWTIMGPFDVAWERISDAAIGSILKL